jgi:hypothetical protein
MESEALETDEKIIKIGRILETEIERSGVIAGVCRCNITTKNRNLLGCSGKRRNKSSGWYRCICRDAVPAGSVPGNRSILKRL